MTIPTLSPVWDGETDETLVVVAVVAETHDVKTFVFASETPRLFSFLPGQFLNLDVEIGGETVTRSYTVSSAPTRPDRVAITVKRVDGGLVSNHLHDRLKVGDRVKAQLPVGDFSHLAFERAGETPKLLFLVAGVGATPALSMLRRLADLADPRDVAFLDWNHAPDDGIARDELDGLAARMPSLNLAHFVTRTAPGDGWTGRRGRITASRLLDVVPDAAERNVYCCGPDGFMTAAREVLIGLGLDPARWHEESFTGSVEAEVETTVDPSAATWKITFAKSGRVVTCYGATPILAAAKKQGVALPSSCAKGLCGTCKTKKVSGEVEMTHQGGIRQREIDAGQILLCCSRPRSDVTLER